MDWQANVLIVDDEPLARDRIRELVKSDHSIQIIGEAHNGSEAIAAITSLEPDIVFLDVQMPDMDGFEVLKRVQGKTLPLIIFVTAYDEHAIRAFEVHAIDYLMKPFDRKRFGQALAHAKSLIKRRDLPDKERIKLFLKELTNEARYLERFSIKNGETVVFVRAEDVESIEAEGNYVRLNLASSSYMLRDTLSSIEAQIDPGTFARIHRSTIVNMDRIKELQNWSKGEYRVVLKSGACHTLSRGYREHFDKLMRTGE
jgi:two-component system, LytTR family, response regulator